MPKPPLTPESSPEIAAIDAERLLADYSENAHLPGVRAGWYRMYPLGVSFHWVPEGPYEKPGIRALCGYKVNGLEGVTSVPTWRGPVYCRRCVEAIRKLRNE